MFIIISIYSKNLNAVTNFLKFLYKLKKNQIFKLKFSVVQSQKKKKFSFFSVLRSPHVNKKSQEQFNYCLHSKKLKIHTSQITKFLVIWKIVKMTLFSEIKIKTVFWLGSQPFNFTLENWVKFDNFKLSNFFKIKTNNSKPSTVTSGTSYTSLNLLDIRGEILLKSFF